MSCSRRRSVIHPADPCVKSPSGEEFFFVGLMPGIRTELAARADKAAVLPVLGYLLTTLPYLPYYLVHSSTMYGVDKVYLPGTTDTMTDTRPRDPCRGTAAAVPRGANPLLEDPQSRAQLPESPLLSCRARSGHGLVPPSRPRSKAAIINLLHILVPTPSTSFWVLDAPGVLRDKPGQYPWVSLTGEEKSKGKGKKHRKLCRRRLAYFCAYPKGLIKSHRRRGEGCGPFITLFIRGMLWNQYFRLGSCCFSPRAFKLARALPA